MHKSAVILLAAAALFAGSGRAQTLQSVPSMPLSQFQDSIGVNIHIEYTDGEYAQYQNVIYGLQSLGIRNVRDEMPDPSKWAPGALEHMQALAAAGIRFDLLLDCNGDFNTQMQQLDAMVTQYPGSVLSVEGPNEINNFPCTAGSGSNQQQATAMQQQLYSYVHGDSNLSGVPVLYMTGADPINLLANPGLADEANAHPYPYKGDQPGALFTSAFSTPFPTLIASTPREITETGYFTLPQQDSGVDETAQAEMIGNIYFDAALQGIKRTYVYQLGDPYNDQTSDDNFGLWNFDLSPKYIASALHNLHDQIPWDAPSNYVGISAKLNGLPASTGKALALTGSDGSIYIFMWNELPVWNNDTHTRIDNPYVPVYVTLPDSSNYTVDYFSPTQDRTFNDLPQQPDGSYAVPVLSFPTAIIFHPKS